MAKVIVKVKGDAQIHIASQGLSLKKAEELAFDIMQDGFLLLVPNSARKVLSPPHEIRRIEVIPEEGDV